MDEGASFGGWLKQRCKELDLTQASLAQCVGCSVTTIKKITAGVRRPSKQVAERLAQCLDVQAAEQAAFLKFARAEQAVPPPAGSAPAPPPWQTPPPVMSRRPNNLPAALNSFIGREKQRERVGELLRRPGVRLLTLAGPPGIGKTRLALQVGQSLLADFADGVFFVALAAVSDPSLVEGVIARTLGITEVARHPLRESLLAYLRNRQLLLVLDNFEQIVAAGPLLVDLLEAAPRLKLLVTSRAVLHLYGEHELRLPPSRSRPAGPPCPASGSWPMRAWRCLSSGHRRCAPAAA